MSPEKLSALKYLDAHGSKTAVEIARHFCGKDLQSYMKWYERLADLQAYGYVWFENDNSFPMCSVILAPPGEDALAEVQQRRNEKAEAKRQQRFQNKISVAQVLVPAVTFILGLIVEHYAGLVGTLGQWIENLIH